MGTLKGTRLEERLKKEPCVALCSGRKARMKRIQRKDARGTELVPATWRPSCLLGVPSGNTQQTIVKMPWALSVKVLATVGGVKGTQDHRSQMPGMG